MAGTRVSDYGVGDTNFVSMVNTEDLAFKGQMSLTLTNIDSVEASQIAAGSWVEMLGDMFKFDRNEDISLIDPLTGDAVTNGPVWLYLIRAGDTINPGDTITAAFSEYPPQWTDYRNPVYDDNRGWYVRKYPSYLEPYLQPYKAIAYMNVNENTYEDKQLLEPLGTGNRIRSTSPWAYTTPYSGHYKPVFKQDDIWTARQAASVNSWQDVCYGNGLYVAVSNTGTGDRVMTSPDGVTWTSRASAADNDWNSVCYGNGLFVAVADTGIGDRVMTSPDGVTWTSRANSVNNDWQAVCYGNGLFVAVANTGTGDRVMTSPDGITWTTQTSSADIDWQDVCYSIYNAVGTATHEYTMVGNNGTVGYSAESQNAGVTWTNTITSSGIKYQAVISAQSKWIYSSVGYYYIRNFRQIIYAGVDTGTGANGLQIGGSISYGAPNNPWTALAFGRNTAVALSPIGTGNRTVSNVADNLTGTFNFYRGWTSKFNPVEETWSAVCYGNGKFVAVASSGSIYRVMTSKYGTM